VSSPQAATRALPRVPRAHEPRVRLRLAPVVSRVPKAPFVLLTGAVVVAGVIALAALTTAVNQQAFSIARLDRDNKAAATQYSVLQSEVDALQAPARVSQVAHERGLKPISKARIVNWPSSQGAGQEASPTPGAATSPAAAGVDTTDPTRDAARAAGRVWTPDDPFPLKHYLAQP
jgi:cell division protein FtsL